MYKILVINPGSTSTELSLFEDETEVKSARIVHPIGELREFENIVYQFPYRSQVTRQKIREWDIKAGELSAVVGRSGIRAVKSGTYAVNQKMVDDVKSGKMKVEHAAVLGSLLAKEIADEYGVPAFVAHTYPVEWSPMVRVSGIPEIERRPVYHIQNIQAVAGTVARDMDKKSSDTNLIIAHLEGGMSIAAIENGRIVDTTSAFDEGPFTMERSGNLPCNSLVELCFSGEYTKAQILKKIRGEGGMVAYLGTNKITEVEERISNGDEDARFYLEAMCYQAAKDIAAMATVIKGKVDAVVLTGKILESERAVEWIKERVSFIAPVKTYLEQEALAFVQAGLKVLRNEISPKIYE